MIDCYDFNVENMILLDSFYNICKIKIYLMIKFSYNHFKFKLFTYIL